MYDKLISIPDEEYHSRSEWSSSDIKFLVNNYLDDLERHKRNFKPSKAMEFGSAIHKFVLEKKEFFGEYAVIPDFEPTTGNPKTSGWKNTNDYKEQLAEFMQMNEGMKLITEDQFNSITAIDFAIRKHPEFIEIMNCGKDIFYEKCVVTEIEYESDLEEGKKVKLPVRAKFDIIIPEYHEDYGLIIDVKSTSDTSKNSFGRDIYTLNYDVQDSFYSVVAKEALGREFKFLFLAVNDPEDGEEAIAKFYELSSIRKLQGSSKISAVLSKIESNQRKAPSETGIEVI